MTDVPETDVSALPFDEKWALDLLLELLRTPSPSGRTDARSDAGRASSAIRSRLSMTATASFPLRSCFARSASPLGDVAEDVCGLER